MPEAICADGELDGSEAPVGKARCDELHAGRTAPEVRVDDTLAHAGRQNIRQHDLLVVVLRQPAGARSCRPGRRIVVESHERSRDLRENLIFVVTRLDQDRLAAQLVASQVVEATGCTGDQQVLVIGGVHLRVRVRAASEQVVEVEPEALVIRQQARVHIRLRLGCPVEVEVVVDELPQVRVLRRKRGSGRRGSAIDPEVVERGEPREHLSETHRDRRGAAVDAACGTRA